MTYYRKARSRSAYPVSAASSEVAEQYLPSLESDYKRAQLLEDVFISTNRRGAGKFGPNSIAIRPRGMGASKTLDSMLEARHLQKKRDKPLSKELEEPKNQVKREIAESIGMVLPRNFCPDCGETNRPHSQGVININRYDHDRPDLHIKANQLVISFFCQKCAEQQLEKQKGPSASDEVILQTSTSSNTIGELYAANRLVRIKKQTEEFIKAKILSEDLSIFPDGVDPYA